jgi:hypothetical protein
MDKNILIYILLTQISQGGSFNNTIFYLTYSLPERCYYCNGERCKYFQIKDVENEKEKLWHFITKH